MARSEEPVPKQFCQIGWLCLIRRGPLQPAKRAVLAAERTVGQSKLD